MADLPIAAAFASRLSGNEDTGTKVAYALRAAERLRLPQLIGDGQLRVQQLAERSGADSDSLNRLMRVLAMVDVFIEVAPGEFRIGPLGRHLEGSPPPLEAGRENRYWRAWEALAEGVSRGRTPYELVHGCGLFDWLRASPKGAKYVDGLARRGAVRDGAVAASYDFSKATAVVDVGGGRGSLLREIAAAHRNVRGAVFDLPEVVEHAHEELRNGGRLSAVAGDFFREPPPAADLYVLSSVLHDWDDERCVRILRSCRRAALPGARLLVVELLLADRSPSFDAVLLDLEMLVLTGGRERTELDFESLLERGGFRFARTLPTGSRWSIVEATAS